MYQLSFSLLQSHFSTQWYLHFTTEPSPDRRCQRNRSAQHHNFSPIPRP
jgi:hypothetical protein